MDEWYHWCRIINVKSVGKITTIIIHSQACNQIKLLTTTTVLGEIVKRVLHKVQRTVPWASLLDPTTSVLRVLRIAASASIGSVGSLGVSQLRTDLLTDKYFLFIARRAFCTNIRNREFESNYYYYIVHARWEFFTISNNSLMSCTMFWFAMIDLINWLNDK